jgi:Na+/H+-dicarboxylate symporter
MAEVESRGRRMPLHWQILIALALAVALGAAADPETRLFGVPLVAALGFVGDLFLRALRMLVMPLIAASIVTGISSVGDTRQLGRLGARTAGYYLLSTLVAVVVGLFWVDALRPGILDGAPARERIGLSQETGAVTERVGGRDASDVLEVFLRMVPENVLRDAVEDQMLGVIFFSLLFGFFATRISEGPRRAVVEFWQGVYEVMLKMTDWVLLFAPVGVFALAGRVAILTGWGAVRPLATFFACVLLALGTHAFVVLPMVLRLVARVRPVAFFRVMGPALLMAFSTASSSGTLPLTLERVQLAGVSRRVSSFTLPLGATVNMDGTALYECVAAVFIAQAYGLELGFAQQFLIVAVAVLTSIGVAGIPAASLVAITLILQTIGLPLEGIGLILAVDRVLDMCRTAVNVFSDSCAALVVARWEGERDLLQPGAGASQ